MGGLFKGINVTDIGKKIFMKTNKIKLQERPVLENLLQYLQRVNDRYVIDVNGERVKVVFSKDGKAPTMEELLVKIATDLN